METGRWRRAGGEAGGDDRVEIGGIEGGQVAGGDRLNTCPGIPKVSVIHAPW